MAVTIKQAQERLKTLGLYDGDLDGLGGPLTAAAVVAFQKKVGLTENGKLDPGTLEALFPHKTEAPRTIQATFQDWIWNGLTSKVNQVAAAAVGLLVTFLATRFGLNIPMDIQVWLVSGISMAALAIIGVLRTRFDSPHVANKAPAVIQKPAEFK